jgi:hypothetical protein
VISALRLSLSALCMNRRYRVHVVEFLNETL